MAFTLRVSAKHHTNVSEATFEREAVLGRTQENDVVINDSNASRRHARIYLEAGHYLLEDLRSANGTKLNDQIVSAPTALRTRDRITIGTVMVEFVLPFSDEVTDFRPVYVPRPEPQAAQRADPNLARTLFESLPELPSVTEPSTIPNPLEVTGPMRLAKPPPPSGPRHGLPHPSAPRAQVSPPHPHVPAPVPSPGAHLPPVEVHTVLRQALIPGGAFSPDLENRTQKLSPDVVRAAARSRERRELQASRRGRLILWWKQLSGGGRAGVGLGLALFLGLGLALGPTLLRPAKAFFRRAPDELIPNGEPLTSSFGNGPGVDFPGHGYFRFKALAPTRLVGLLHYRASDCALDEVGIELNGAQVGTVNPDLRDLDREVELVLPASLVKVGEPNELSFQSLLQPEETWRVWGLWVELIPIPGLSNEEAIAKAKESLNEADNLFELQKLGSLNLFKSWKKYREAWLLLEATSPPPPELITEARSRMAEIRPDLDRRCSSILVEYQKEMTQRYPDLRRTRKLLQNVPNHFGKEHPCLGMSQYLLQGLVREQR